MKTRSHRRHGPNRRRFVVSMVALAVLAGCSGGANPVDRLRARLQLKEGNQSYLDGRYDEAVQRYDKAIRLVPQLAPAFLNRAFSKEALVRTTEAPEERRRLAREAVESFEKYLSLLDQGGVGVDPKAPGRERIESHILTLLVDSQQVDEAIIHLQERYQRDPRDTSALEMLSRLEMERGRFDEAMEWLRKRVAAEPQDPDAHYSVGAFVWLMSYRDTSLDPVKRATLIDEGMASLERALELRPDDFETLIYINLLYLEKAKYAEGEAQRSAFEARARALRERALALQKAAADSAAALAGVNPEAAPGAADSAAAASATDSAPASAADSAAADSAAAPEVGR